jgi:hypothetical protein
MREQSVTPDFDVSLAFLRQLYPSGPWMLTSISVDKLKIESRTFTPSDEDDVVKWLELHRSRNLYYSVNEPVEKAHEKKKLEKTDVLRVHYLHVDVDPRAPDPGDDPTEHYQREQARILRQFEQYAVPPTALVFSGGGFNGLWRLDTPVDVAAHAPSQEEAVRRAIDVERRNWQFELDFSTPDHCRDVSRILRLPGTVNRPDEKKVRRGRVPAIARVIYFTDVAYPLTQFVATPIVAANQGSGLTRVSENVRRVESLAELNVPDKIKILIAQGFDPDDAKFSGADRSVVLFYVCCELVRHKVDDAVILGVITDSRYQISASVLDKGSSSRRYALRQVSRAKDRAINPKLAEMNDRYAVVGNYGGRCMILISKSESVAAGDSRLAVADETSPSIREYEFQRPVEFFRAMDHDKIDFVDRKGRPTSRGVASWWFDQNRRRQYDHVVFEPGLDTPGDLNLWRGFAVEPQPGRSHVRYLEHVHENICSGDDASYDYVLSWMARVVQFPRTQSMVAPVFLSPARGTGKSVFCGLFAKIFEPHSWIVDNSERLTGNFNAHLADRVLVVAEEAFDLRDKRHESVLKELITGQWRSVEKKGVDIVRRPNYVHLMLTSNNDRVVPAGDHERRYMVLNVGTKRLQDSVYFKQIVSEFCTTDEMGSRLRPDGGGAHLLHHLMSLDLSTFDVTKYPHTEALREQQEHNLSTENEWLLQKLETGVWMSGRERWEGPVLKNELYQNYTAYCRLLNIRFIQPYRIWHQWLVKTLGKGRVVSRQLITSSHDRPWAFEFPPLDDARGAYLKCRGWSTYDWPPIMRLVEDTGQARMQLPGATIKNGGAFE